MKKGLVLVLALLMVLTSAFAQEVPTVYVSITDDTGALVMAYEPVSVTDLDADGALSIGDALAAAHALKHENGAEAFGAERTEFGMSMTKLWGVENGGSYGYALNDVSSSNLLDEVASGDHVKAYAYTDLAAWSDTYSYFGAPVMEAKVGQTIELALNASGFDASFMPITFAAAEAVVTVNGEATEAKTNADGRVSIAFDAAGTYVLSAESETMTLVAPVCLVTVSE